MERMTEEKTGLLRTEIESALKTTQDAYSGRADKMLDRYSTGKSAWNYSLAFALVEMMKATLVAQEPLFINLPLNKDGEEIGPVYDKLLNHYAHMLDLRSRAEEAADWEDITGLAVAKIGYSERESQVIGQPSADFLGEIWLQILNPKCFFVDPYCTKTDLSDARYCGDVAYIPKADAINSPLYNPAAIVDITPDLVGGKYPEAKEYTNSSRLPDEYGLIELREMHLRNRTTGRIEVVTFAKNGLDPVRELAELPEPFKSFMYVPMTFFPIPGKFYGMSILERVWDVCNMMDNAMSRISNRWATSPEKIAAPLDNLGKDHKQVMDALTSPILNEIIDTGMMPGKDAIHLVHGQIIFPDELQYLHELINLFQWISGMSYIQLGSGSSRTATEAGLVGQSADMRSARRMSVMERWVSTIGQRLLTILRYAHENLPCREILGDEDYQKWMEYERRQTQRERTKQDTDITVRMSLPVHTAALHRRDKAIEMLGRLASPELFQLMMMQGTMIDVPRLAQDILKDSGLSDNYLIPITDEMRAMLGGMQQGGQK